MIQEDNKIKYQKRYNQNVKNILKQIEDGNMTINDLNEEQKDLLIGYFSKQITIKKDNIRKIRKLIKKGEV